MRAQGSGRCPWGWAEPGVPSRAQAWAWVRTRFREAACLQKNLKNVETTFLEERRGREQLLSQQKKLIDRIRSKDTGYRHQVSPGVLKWVFQRALLTAQPLPRTRRTDIPLTYKKTSYGVSACLLHPGQGTDRRGWQPFK